MLKIYFFSRLEPNEILHHLARLEKRIVSLFVFTLEQNVKLLLKTDTEDWSLYTMRVRLLLQLMFASAYLFRETQSIFSPPPTFTYNRSCSFLDVKWKPSMQLSRCNNLQSRELRHRIAALSCNNRASFLLHHETEERSWPEKAWATRK